MPHNFDCCVVGAGFTGISAALALARLGLRSVVLDASAETDAIVSAKDTRGLALALSSARVLAALDIWAQLKTVVSPLSEIHVSHAGHFGITRLRSNDLACGALGYVCPAEKLREVLWQAALACPDISLWRATGVAKVYFEAKRAILTVERENCTETINAALLIGADGRDSRVRECLGIKAKVRDYRQSAIIANVDVSRPQPGVAYERFTSSGPLAILPLEGRRYVVVRTARAAQVPKLLALSDRAFSADVEQRFGLRLGRLSRPSEREPHELLLSLAARFALRRALLIGSGASTVHPNAAQGLNLGLRDVAALHAMLATTLAAAGDIGNEPAVASFANKRRAEHRRVAGFTDLLAQSFGFSGPLVGGLASATMLTLDLVTPLKRRFMTRLMGLRRSDSELLRPRVL